MNREIKFRMWRDGRMQGIHTMFSQQSDSDTPSKEPQNFACNEEEILMQYTGLKDKNGKDVYEGDVFAPSPKNYWQVFFYYGAFTCGKYEESSVPLAWNPHDEESMEEDNPSEWLEVIGNIYENPELINK